MNRTCRILIFEHDENASLELERGLRDLGYEIVGRADSLQAALELARETRPDLILMDTTLGGGQDGIGAGVEIALSTRQIHPEPVPSKDVGEIQRVVEDLRISEERLKIALAGKDTLLREVHHRVKNNMQVVMSLLSLQSASIQDTQVQVLFEESKNRLRSMALVHEILYRSPDVASIDLNTYLNQLCGNLQHTYCPDERIKLEVRVEDVELEMDTCITCGLIVNELVSNAFKYAFPDGRKGIVQASLSRQDGQVRLVVEDDGIGLPVGFNLDQQETLGLHLVKILADQLSGILEYETKTEFGSRFWLQFKFHPVQTG